MYVDFYRLDMQVFRWRDLVASHFRTFLFILMPFVNHVIKKTLAIPGNCGMGEVEPPKETKQKKKIHFTMTMQIAFEEKELLKMEDNAAQRHNS